ncbi:MAG TPA: AEC family transporter [Azoarcus sp.]|nr:AEC family transporter [Azoarcus sp.]
MAVRIIEILFPLFTITAVGYFVGRRMKPDLSQANKLNMDVFVPALVFSALANRGFSIEGFMSLAAATLVVVIGSGAAAWLMAKALRIELRTLVPPIMFNNCGNLGLPLAVLAFGDSALAPMVVMFVISNLLHFSYGAWLLDRSISVWSVWRVPLVLATFAGLAVVMGDFVIWEPLLVAIRMLGEISIPLMLFALGVRMADSTIGQIGHGTLVAVARPLIGMALVFAVLPFIDLPPEQRALLIMFGALPPAVLNYIFAERYDQEPATVASMVLIGNLAAIISLPIALVIALP